MFYYILRYGEIALKGKNRINFENKLKSNVLNFIKNKYNSKAQISSIRGRFILESEIEVNLKSIFGLVSYSIANKLEKDLNKVVEFIQKNIKIENKTSFKIQTSRLDKNFSMKSPEINNFIGSKVFNDSNLKVDLSNPDLIIGVEIHNDFIYIYQNKIDCFGGLPIGSAGKIGLFVKQKNRTILSALELMKRGCEIAFITNKSFNSDLVREFNNYRDLIQITETEFKSHNLLGLAIPEHFKSFKEHDEDNNFLNLYPIAFYSEQEVKEKLNYYEQIQKH